MAFVTSAARKRWHRSMRGCPTCNRNADLARSHYCLQHRTWLDQVEAEENRSILARAAAAPLPPPPPLPPRKPTRFE